MLTAIRNWLDENILQPLKSSLANGFFVVDSGKGNEKSLVKMDITIKPKRFWGVVPIPVVQKVGTIPLAKSITTSFQTARDVFVLGLRQIPKKILSLVGEGVKGSTNNRIRSLKIRTEGEAEKLLRDFDEKKLRGFIKTDRNVFRQRLLEELGKQSSQVFAKAIKKRLADLVMKVRQEIAEDSVDGGNSNPKDLLALPTGTRFFVRKGKMTVFVIEQAPQTRTLKIMDADGERSQMYQLSFPYTVFFLVLRGRKSESMYAFFRNKPLRSVNDELLCPALPNIYDNFKVCFSPSASKDSVAVMAEESIGNFWGGRFIKTHDPSNLTRQISADNWAEETKKDALFGLSHNWRRTGFAVSEMLESIHTDFEIPQTESGKAGKSSEVMSALNKTVDGLTTSLVNEMKEICFNLVPEWTVDETVFARILSAFSEILATLSESVKIECGKEIETILSQEDLKQLFEIVVQTTIDSLYLGDEKVTRVAHKSLLAQLEAKLEVGHNDTDLR